MWTKSDDIKLVKKLEKETGIELQRISLENIGRIGLTGFAANHNGRVRVLAIWNKKLLRLPALLSKFQRLDKMAMVNNQISDISSLKKLKGLTVLRLNSNQISDISSLKELKNLKILSLRNNKINHMPAEFLDLGLAIKWEYDGREGIFLEDNPWNRRPRRSSYREMRQSGNISNPWPGTNRP